MESFAYRVPGVPLYGDRVSQSAAYTVLGVSIAGSSLHFNVRRVRKLAAHRALFDYSRRLVLEGARVGPAGSQVM